MPHETVTGFPEDKKDETEHSAEKQDIEKPVGDAADGDPCGDERRGSDGRALLGNPDWAEEAFL